MNAESGAAATNTNNPFSMFINVWVSPSQAFVELKTRNLLWYPLLTVMLALVIVNIVYSQMADFSWLMEQTIANSGREFTEQQRQAMEQMQNGSLGSILAAVGGSIAVIVGIPLTCTLFSGYLTLVSNFTADGYGFKNWFAFTAWCSTPLLFGALASLVVILLSSNGQISQTDMNPLTLNALIFHIPDGQAGSAFYRSVSAPLIWSVLLQLVGYRAWTGKGTATSALVILIPALLIFGIIALVSFR